MVPHGSGKGSESRFRTFVNSRCCSPATLVGLRSYNTAILQDMSKRQLRHGRTVQAGSMADLSGHVKCHRARLRPACPACHPFPPWLAATVLYIAGTVPTPQLFHKCMIPLQNFLQHFFLVEIIAFWCKCLVLLGNSKCEGL